MRCCEVVNGLEGAAPGQKIDSRQSLPSTLAHAKEEAIAELNSNKNSAAVAFGPTASPDYDRNMGVNERTSRRRCVVKIPGFRRQSILVLIVTYILSKRISSLKHSVMRDNLFALISCNLSQAQKLAQLWAKSWSSLILVGFRNRYV
jgi:hypothetical protein